MALCKLALKRPSQERDRGRNIAQKPLSMQVSRGRPFCQEVWWENFAALQK